MSETSLNNVKVQPVNNAYIKTGLSSKIAAQRLQDSGFNALPESKPPSFALLFIRQFKSPFIYVLLIAALVSFLLNHTTNGFFIFAVLLLNAGIGSFQEHSAEKAANALKAMVPHMANVLRDGHSIRINSKELVSGDIVFLSSGDRVPADGLCIETEQLTLDESMLTGESKAVLKHASRFLSDSLQIDLGSFDNANLEKTNNGEDSNYPENQRCFAGTTVNKGRGVIYINRTGSDTEIGKIASAAAPENQAKPPLLHRIERFTLNVTIATLLVIAVIFVISLSRGDPLSQVFFLGVALAVSAIPEGLPAAITVALAIGMRRMAKVNVIVRSLLAVESLGSCTYIASDKTGTLTVNDMTVQKLLLKSGKEFKIKGEGRDIDPAAKPADVIEQNNIEQITHVATRDIATDSESLANSGNRAEPGSEPEPEPDSDSELNNANRLALIGALCNESDFYQKQGQWHAQGDQVDIALLVLATKLGLKQQELKNVYPEISRIAYESENAFSASLNQDGDSQKYIFSVKGSVEKLISMCELSEQESKEILAQVDQLAKQGYRVLGFAEKYLKNIPNDLTMELNQLSFVGMVGIIDPLRKEALGSIESCKQAHIKVSMITGDHPETAKAIAKELGIFETDQEVILGETISALSKSDPDELNQVIANNNVFARVKPIEKKIIVEQLQAQGHFVAVTGDGVNDAPAIRTAHVGIAMGKRGTDVARESSDLILTDDNFSSIVKGIVQGRIVYANIRKVVFLLISTGAAEIILFILSLLAGLPLPLFPIQLLWLNLVTNGIQDVALAFEPAEGNELKHPPRSPKESIFNRLMIERVLINALVMGITAFILFSFCLKQGMSEFEARNMTLLLMVLFENVHALNSRSEKISLFKLPFFSNKLLLLGILIAQGIHIGAMYIDSLKELLGLTPVSLQQWAYLLAVALILIVVAEGHKWLRRGKV